MPTKRIPFGDGVAILTEQSGWKKGDQPPASKHDYLGWHAWAEVQHKAGLRQTECGKCGRWQFPQELSGKTTTAEATRRNGQKVKIVAPVCNACDTQSPQRYETKP
jgi:hypothetical protein